MAENVEILTTSPPIYDTLQEQINDLRGLEDPYAAPIKYSIEEMFDKECVYVLVHQHPKIDTEVYVFQNLSKAVGEAVRIAEESINGNYPSLDEIKQLHWDDVLYCLYYPIDGYVWIVRREIQ